MGYFIDKHRLRAVHIYTLLHHAVNVKPTNQPTNQTNKHAK